MHILSDVIRAWVSRWFSHPPKTQHQEAKEAVEDRLRRHGFVKGVDGVWRESAGRTDYVAPDDYVKPDWWTPKNRR
jgi:hypothetical protein